MAIFGVRSPPARATTSSQVMPVTPNSKSTGKPTSMVKQPHRSQLPFVDLSESETADLMLSKARVGSDYKRLGFGYPDRGVQYADSTSNVIRACILRKSRIEAGKGVKFKRLDGFLGLPLDIIFSILDYLHPIDFYHLELSSPLFQNLLSNQTPLLEKVYQAHGVPIWPPEVSYERWSDLLFGDAVCDRCRRFVALPDFVHRQRVCTECFKIDFEWSRGHNAEIKMIPMGTRSEGWRITKPSLPSQQYYGIREEALARKIKAQLSALKKSLATSLSESTMAESLGVSASDEELKAREQVVIDEFMEERRVSAQVIMLHAYDCELWAYNLFYELNEDIKKYRNDAASKLGKRLTRRGCTNMDFINWAAVMSQRWCNVIQPDHKRKSFTQTLLVLKSYAIQARDERFKYERNALYKQRTQLLSLAYTNYITSCSSSSSSSTQLTTSPTTASTITQPTTSTATTQPPTATNNSTQTPATAITNANATAKPTGTSTTSGRPLWSFPPVETFLASAECQALIKKPAKDGNEPRLRRYEAWVRGLFADETILPAIGTGTGAGVVRTGMGMGIARGKWVRDRKDALEKSVVLPKSIKVDADGYKMGLVIATFTCSICRDHVRKTQCLACQVRMSTTSNKSRGTWTYTENWIANASGSASASASGDATGNAGRWGGWGDLSVAGDVPQHRQHHHHSCRDPSASARGTRGGVGDSFDNPTGVVLFGWDEVKEHMVCVKVAQATMKSGGTGTMASANASRGSVLSPTTPSRRPSASASAPTSPPSPKSNIKTNPNPNRNTNTTVKGMTFNKRASDLMLIILQKMGDLDPTTTTAGDLDRLGKGFVCYASIGVSPTGTATATKAKTRVFGWRDFVIHVLRHGRRECFPISSSVDKLLVKVV